MVTTDEDKEREQRVHSREEQRRGVTETEGCRNRGSTRGEKLKRDGEIDIEREG